MVAPLCLRIDAICSSFFQCHPKILFHVFWPQSWEANAWKLKKRMCSMKKANILHESTRQVIIDLVDIGSSWKCLTQRGPNSFNGNQFLALHYFSARDLKYTHIYVLVFCIIFTYLSVCREFSCCESSNMEWTKMYF